MATRGIRTFKRSMFWIGASLASVLVGLVMVMHEQHAHYLCAASMRHLALGPTQPAPVCGFADTVYWAGMVIFIAGAVSLVASMWSGVTGLSGALHKGRPTLRSRIWSSSRDRHVVADRADGVLPLPAVWLSKLATPAPFEVRLRRPSGDLVPAGRSTLSVSFIEEIVPTSMPDHVVVTQGAVRVVATQSAVLFVPSQGTDTMLPLQGTDTMLPLQGTDTMLPFQGAGEAAHAPAVSMSPPAHQSVPTPAWYPDPDSPEAIRWWDGSKWGESRPRRR